MFLEYKVKAQNIILCSHLQCHRISLKLKSVRWQWQWDNSVPLIDNDNHHSLLSMYKDRAAVVLVLGSWLSLCIWAGQLALGTLGYKVIRRLGKRRTPRVVYLDPPACLWETAKETEWWCRQKGEGCRKRYCNVFQLSMNPSTYSPRSLLPKHDVVHLQVWSRYIISHPKRDTWYVSRWGGPKASRLD